LGTGAPARDASRSKAHLPTEEKTMGGGTSPPPHFPAISTLLRIATEERMSISSTVRRPRRNGNEWAKEFLAERLEAGPVKSNDILDEAKQKGIAEKDLKWAKKALGVRSRKGSEAAGTWFWELPEKNAPKGADAVAHIFGASSLADEILRAIQRNPNGMSRTVIRNIFGRHQPGSRIRAALSLLASKGLARKYVRQIGGRRSRPTEIWTATEKRESRETPPEAAGSGQGLSDHRIAELADWYAGRARRLYSPATTVAVVLDPELRAILHREAGPELVEIEFARVIEMARRK
jgi:hypothetical protein